MDDYLTKNEDVFRQSWNFWTSILDEDTMLHVLASVELEYDSNTMLATWQEAAMPMEGNLQIITDGVKPWELDMDGGGCRAHGMLHLVMLIEGSACGWSWWPGLL